MDWLISRTEPAFCACRLFAGGIKFVGISFVNAKLGAGVLEVDDCHKTFEELIAKEVDFIRPLVTCVPFEDPA